MYSVFWTEAHGELAGLLAAGGDEHEGPAVRDFKHGTAALMGVRTRGSGCDVHPTIGTVRRTLRGSKVPCRASHGRLWISSVYVYLN